MTLSDDTRETAAHIMVNCGCKEPAIHALVLAILTAAAEFTSSYEVVNGISGWKEALDAAIAERED